MADNTNAMITTNVANEILKNYFCPRAQQTDSKGAIIVTARPIYVGLGLNTSNLNKNTTEFIEPWSLCGVDDNGNATNGYARVNIAKMDEPDGGQTQNTDIIFFNETRGDGWGNVAYFGLFTSATKTESPFFWAKLTDTNGAVTTKQIPGEDSEGNGYIPIFRAGKLKIAIDREPVEKTTSATA